ncbi:MAG: hypothetical protein DRJ47_08135 [Thermoprotei archaeon]|nr:MAG: hypothetical protein DRJ47_08135 [Thermoprotei archaeon]
MAFERGIAIKGIRVIALASGEDLRDYWIPCVVCGSKDIVALGISVPRDEEVYELSDGRVVIYGLCDECASLDGSVIEEAVIDRLRRSPAFHTEFFIKDGVKRDR